MSRLIKFRQWITAYKRWHVWGFLQPGIFTGPENPTDPSCEFTGLLDRHGKEICEGDVVEFVKEAQVIDLQDRKPRRRIVKWDDENARFDFYWMNHQRQTSGYMFTKNNLLSAEILGNIYEQPESMKP